MPSLSDRAKQWIDGQAFVSLATINADGSPQSTVHWVARDGDDLLLSTVRGRRHADNLERDPRVSVLLIAPDDPYSYLEVRATATVTEEGGRELIDDLMEKYHGRRPYPWDGPDAVRLVVRVPPEHVVDRGA
ncbi:MAG TPA: PPOX class F420-dependent oxidoreductase [Frankiaceae bacterium]|jgi:PPOX class probable F420-dependent enzyme|nr:PPOX class F420-dependent oxidoreductase [Frankiaceae bacterium]